MTPRRSVFKPLVAGALAATAVLVLAACASPPASAPPLRIVPQVDIPRFMGTWYVIGVIPTVFEKNAFNAVERYTLRPDGKIDVLYSYRDGGFDGAAKTMESTATVQGGNGAVWGVQFVWPFKADYRVVHLGTDYDTVIVGREKRDYVWVMARRPTLPEADYQRLVALVAEQGYDTAKLLRAPQRW